MWSRKYFTGLSLLLILILPGCGGFGYHRVQSGETLYSISWSYGLDYREVAGWNRLKDPYTIYPGQQLRVLPPVDRAQESRAKPVSSRQTAGAASEPVTMPSARLAAGRGRPIQWQWPAQGKLIQTYSGTENNRKGIDIGGKLGQAVRAAAAGHVVYAGSGLLNYGKLIILKHDDNYLSAYAYNQALLVNDGDVVSAGQHIANMGNRTGGEAELHFEIRYDGRPIDPLKYLPPARH